MRRRSLIVAGLLAGLAACSGEPATEMQAADGNAAADVENVAVAETNESAALPDATADPDTPVSSEPPATVSIPEALRGRWGLVAADCTSTRGDAKGLIDVSDTQIRFYESRATLTEVVEQDATRIVGDFGFTGEGQTWERRMVLDGQDGGRTLIRREQGADAMPGMLRYRKCETA